MPELFGTDGVRGIPGRPPLTADLIRRLGFVAAQVLSPRERRNGDRRPVLLCRDTRDSGVWIGKALSDGFRRAGLAALDLGVLPTPAVSCLAPRWQAPFGVVISASHNPPEFNGVKFFSPKGYKLAPALERKIESGLDALGDLPPAVPLPRCEGAAPAAEFYRDFLVSTFPPELDLTGLRVVFDGAHGAAARIGPELLRGLGAEVFAVGCAPDGRNINRGCGALDTGRMRREVVRRRAHFGVSLDGDADRAVFSDERGRLLEGDDVIALSALHLREQGLLRGDAVVVTVMSNLGLVRFLEGLGIGVIQVPVGDRNVTEALEARGLVLGGENSGHVVFRRLNPTGDGLLTCLQTLAAWRRTGGPMSRLHSLFRRYPQILKNIHVAERVPLEELKGFTQALARAEARIKDRGRIFVRYSGTEPLLRILVESADPVLTRNLADGLSAVFREEVKKL